MKSIVRNNLKKGLSGCLTVALLLGVSMGLAGCGKDVPAEDSKEAGTKEESAQGGSEKAEEKGERVEIVYWNQWTQETEINFLEKYVEEYNNSQDKYHVTFLAVPFEEYTTTKLATAFATNEAPDVFECSPAIINQYLDAGVCEPLDDIMTDQVRSDFTEAAFDRVTRDGKIYGIPLDSDLVALYYNKEMLEEKGVQPPSTWEELKEAAAKLNTENCSGFTFEVDKGDWQCFTFYPFVWMQGGNLFTEDGMANLNSEEVVNALQLWKDLLDSGNCNETPGRSVSDISILTNGETAMQINGSWSVLRADPDKYGVVPLPAASPDTGSASVAGGWNVLISNQGDEEKIAGVKDFVSWMWLDKNHVSEFNTEVKFSYCMRDSVIEAGKEVYQSNDNAITFSDKVLQTAKPEIALSGEAKEIVSIMIQDALYNMDAKAAADLAQESMLQYQKDSGAKFTG